MKKAILTLIMLVATTISVKADVDSVRYLTTRFRRNWFISADATVNWWQSSLRSPATFTNNFTKVDFAHPKFGFTVNFGKWINHKTAVRVSYDNTTINSFIYGRHPNLSHIQYLYGDTPTLVEAHNGMEVYKTSAKFHNIRAEYMVSPIDFFQGYYNPDRVYTPVLYLSAGGSLVSNDFFLTKSIIDYVNYERDKIPEINACNFELSLGVGLCNNFRISEHFDINLDINWLFQRWTIDSWTYEFGGNSAPGGGVRPKRFDNLYSVGLGLTYYFSRIYDLYETDSLQQKLQEFVNMPEPAPCDTIVKFVNLQTEEMVSYPFSIFFHIDSYQLMSKRDLVNLREIANVAKENGYKLRLRGSCDSATATPAYNQTLSENRCRKIMSELMKMGIPEDQIILVPVGGVKELDPTEYDRRVLIELVKEASN